MTRQYFGWFQYRGLHYSGITMIFGKEAPRNLNKSTSTNQKASWKKKLNPILDEAKNDKRKVFFVDAAHFVLAPFLGFLWSINRLFIKAPAGRKRFNVLGALDAITHELVTVTSSHVADAAPETQKILYFARSPLLP